MEVVEVLLVEPTSVVEMAAEYSVASRIMCKWKSPFC